MVCSMEPQVVYLDKRRCTVIVENGYNIDFEVEDELKFNLVASQIETHVKRLAEQCALLGTLAQNVGSVD